RRTARVPSRAHRLAPLGGAVRRAHPPRAHPRRRPGARLVRLGRRPRLARPAARRERWRCGARARGAAGDGGSRHADARPGLDPRRHSRLPAAPAGTRRTRGARQGELRPRGHFESRAYVMQTSFSPAQLADPETAESAGIVRKCVHCGFCTATCPTYVLLGDELDSPRGRIYLIKDMLEHPEQPVMDAHVRHVDRCLSCLSCMTTCPSGVHFGHLVDHARSHIERHYRRPLPERLLRAALGWLLPSPFRFRLALIAAMPLRWLGGAVPGRLGAMLRLAPAAPHPP